MHRGCYTKTEHCWDGLTGAAAGKPNEKSVVKRESGATNSTYSYALAAADTHGIDSELLLFSGKRYLAEALGVPEHAMNLKGGDGVKVNQGNSQLQTEVICGLHAIAMAITFVFGKDLVSRLFATEKCVNIYKGVQ